MAVWFVIGAAFVLTTVLSWRTNIHPAAYGCLIPFAAMGVMLVALLAFRLGNSTAPVGIFFVAIFAAIGSIPGTFVGGWLRSRDSAWRP